MMQNWIANVPKSYWILALAIVPVAVYLQKNRLPTPICRVVARLGFYPMLPLTVASQYLRGRWYDELEPGVLMGAVPLVTLFDHVGTLYKKHNVRAVVNLMDEYEGPVETYQLLGIDQLRLPTVDHSDMTEADLLAAVRFIARHKQLGHSVYIHCKAGHGRGATTAFAWLLYSGFGDKARIQAHMGRVRRVRSTIFDRHMAGFLRSIGEAMTPLLTTSRFYEEGVMTPEEFVKAGDQLVASCATWQWASGDASMARSYLPKDKQFLITRNVPSTRRAHTYLADGVETRVTFGAGTGEDADAGADEWTLTHSDPHAPAVHEGSTDDAGEDKSKAKSIVTTTGDTADADIPEMEDSEDENADDGGLGIVEDDDAATLTIAGRVIGPRGASKANGEAKDGIVRVEEPEEKFVKTRTYDISIVYDRYYRTPRLYLLGYDENGQPLSHDQINEDVSADHAGKTITPETHPLTGVANLSIHPCRHASTMKRLLDSMLEREMELAAEARGRLEAQLKREQEEKDADLVKWQGLLPATQNTAGSTSTASAVVIPKDEDVANAALRKKMPVESYLFLFLKFIASVLPTIEYDYTIAQSM